MIVDVTEGRTFDEIRVGETASLARTLTAEQLQLVAAVAGDVDPAHVELWGSTLISSVLATTLPGPGAILVSQQLRFRGAIAAEDTLTATITTTAKDPSTHRVTFDCRCVNQSGELVVEGSAELVVGSTRMSRPRDRRLGAGAPGQRAARHRADRKSTRLNSSHFVPSLMPSSA